jgi:hypothetical protein
MESQVQHLFKLKIQAGNMLDAAKHQNSINALRQTNTTTACIKCAAGQYIGMGAVACRDCIVGTADTGPKAATACQTCSAVSFTAASNTVGSGH